MFEEIVKEIEVRCANKLETQDSIAISYSRLLLHIDVIHPSFVERANYAVKSRYPSRSGFVRVKKMAWKIIEKSIR